MQSSLPAIHSHDSWSPLEEVWLGDVYPATWYDHLEPDVRDIFHKLTEITQQDLALIQSRLQDMGVIVRRPLYEKIDHYLDQRDLLRKPQITPRDQFVVIGTRLVAYDPELRPWRPVIDQYLQDPRCQLQTTSHHCINGANVVRAGRDILIDRDVFEYEYHGEYPEYRVMLVRNGGHMDGCFAILKPGLILANHYYNDYERTFPGWEVIRLDDPTYKAYPSQGFPQPYPVHNGKFFDTTVGTNRAFNQHIIQHALDWVGDYTETFFELNCLVIDERNVMMLAENEQLAETLARHGITVHWVPFRARSFWDGAMHCLTLDIRRRGTIVDYFPERERQ